MIRTKQLATGLAVSLGMVAVLALSGTATAATETAPKADWEQPKVQAASAGFLKAVNDLLQSSRLEDSMNQSQTNQVYLVIEDLKSLRRFAQRLDRQIAAGDSEESTAPLFQRTLRLIDRLRVSVPATPLFESQLPKIRAARTELEALAPFYGVTLPPQVAAPSER
jgi:hypothetical protein